MDYFSPGLKEIARVVARWRNQWRLHGVKKQLAKAETELGLLGWQQAEFDPVTQREVDKIQQTEREQARLTNESAAISQAIADLRTQREQARLAFETKSVPLAAERKTLRESIEKAGAQVSLLRKQIADYESREPQLERDLREATRLQHHLLAMESHTPEMRDQQVELRDRITTIPGRIAETQRQRARAQAEQEELKKTIAQETARETALGQQARELEAAQEAGDRRLADAISVQENARGKIEAENTRLDKDKINPYREIGRVLADNHLPPMNQPQALDTVRDSRLRVQEIEYAIAKSRADSDAADRALVQNSLILLGAILLALGLVIGTLIPR